MNAGLRNAIKVEMQCRARRYGSIPPDLLGEPAWDILLDLAISYLDGQRIQTTAVGLNAGLPPTTALRWVAQLAERGLVRRIPDETDGRRTWLELTPETMARIAACFGFGEDTAPAPAGANTAADAEDRPLFFGAGASPAPDLAAHVLQPAGEKAVPRSLLLQRATDWFDQDYDERLGLAAQTLYVHGYLSPHEFRRVDRQVRDDAEEARVRKIETRRRTSERPGG